MASLKQIVTAGDSTLQTEKIGDWDNALNGLQIENSGKITKIGAAVDASTRTFELAGQRGINLLIVHHGLFWSGLQPVTGIFQRQLRIAFENDLALYSAHLPLDLHPTLGNNALLAASIGIRSTTRFLDEKGQKIGLKCRLASNRTELAKRLGKSLGGPIRQFNFG